MPEHEEVPVEHLVARPKISYFQGERALIFNGVVHNYHGNGIIGVDGSGRLQVAKFMEGESKNAPLLNIKKQCA